jgi:hypothetical protein
MYSANTISCVTFTSDGRKKVKVKVTILLRISGNFISKD